MALNKGQIDRIGFFDGLNQGQIDRIDFFNGVRGGHARGGQKAPAPHPPRKFGLSPGRYIHFYGQAANNPNTFWAFGVLPGDTAPTITGGYAQWQVVGRPLYRALTVFTGYEPSSMQVSVRFMQFVNGSWATDDQTAGGVELDIAKLDWMAGAGNESGPPPFVWLSTSDDNGRTSGLIPFNYQLSPTANVPTLLRNHYLHPWVITSLTWDQNPVRNQNGFRIRQDATVTLQLYEGGSQATPSAAHRTDPKLKGKSFAYLTHAGLDTALKIAAQANTSGDRFSLAQAIIKFPQNAHLHLRSITQKIRHGARIFVPWDF